MTRLILRALIAACTVPSLPFATAYLYALGDTTTWSQAASLAWALQPASQWLGRP